MYIPFNQEIVKVKSSKQSVYGISRYFDPKDVTGKYPKHKLIRK